MTSLNLPAGAPVRLTATARPDRGLHRWDVEVLAAADGAPRLAFASQIGGRDIHQTIQIPPQDVDCRLGVQSRHKTAGGWANDTASIPDDNRDRLDVGFCEAGREGALPHDVLLSFAFGRMA